MLSTYRSLNVGKVCCAGYTDSDGFHSSTVLGGNGKSVELLELHIILCGGVEGNGGCALSDHNVEFVIAPGPRGFILIKNTVSLFYSGRNSNAGELKGHIPVATVAVTTCVSVKVTESYVAELTAYAVSLISTGRTYECMSVLFKKCNYRALHCGPVLTVGSTGAGILVYSAVNLNLIAKSELDFPA